MAKRKYLFLDDLRNPYDCIVYMQRRGFDSKIYTLPWEIVRSYTEFTDWIQQNGVPGIISFDHDLGETDKSGFDCAKYLLNYCIDNKVKVPVYLIHSSNPVGAENIKSLLEGYLN